MKVAPGAGVEPLLERLTEAGWAQVGFWGSFWGPAVAPAVDHRLVGDARVIGAIGHAGRRPRAAIAELVLAGIADRPAAGGFLQLHDRAALTHRHDIVELGQRLDMQVGHHVGGGPDRKSGV